MFSPSAQFFSINLQYLCYVGLLPQYHWPTNKKILYTVYQNLLHGMAASYVVFTTVGSYQNKHNFISFMENLVKTLVGYNYFFKTVTFIINCKNFNILINDIKMSGDIITEKSNKNMSLLVIGSTVFTLSIISSFSLLSVLDQKMPVEIWLPFNPYECFTRLLLGHQIVAVMFLVLQLRAVAMQGIVCSLMMYICDQLTELQNRIISLDYAIDRNEEVRNELKEIIRKHVRIIRYGKIMTDIFKSFFFIQNLAVTVEICLNALMVTVIGHEQRNLLITFAAFLFVALLNAYVFCYLGNELIIKSTGIALAAYETNWTSWPLSLQKDLRTVIIVSQRPINLSAGGLAIMSIQTFAQTLYNGYSIYAVLQDTMKKH